MERSPALRAGGHPAIAFAQNSRGEVRLESGHGQLIGALSTGGGKPGQGQPTILSLSLRGRDEELQAEVGESVSPTLRASGGGGDKGYVLAPTYEAHFQYIADGTHVAGGVHWCVRRLMPVECERLQGMPDQYTQVLYRGKPAADSPRYRAIGNSMAVPCLTWLGERLLRVLR